MLLELKFVKNPKIASWFFSPEKNDKARQVVAKAIAIAFAICDHLENDTPPSALIKARSKNARPPSIHGQGSQSR